MPEPAAADNGRGTLVARVAGRAKRRPNRQSHALGRSPSITIKVRFVNHQFAVCFRERMVNLFGFWLKRTDQWREVMPWYIDAMLACVVLGAFWSIWTGSGEHR